MDTKLKKFNFSMLKKIIALLLCLVSAVGISIQLVSTAKEMHDTRVDFDVYADAFTYSGKKEDIWKTSTFRHTFNNYVDNLTVMISEYDNGSKESYNKKLEVLNGDIEEAYQNCKRSLISLLQRTDSSVYFLCALENGDITALGRIAEYDGDGDTERIDELDISDNWYYDEVHLSDFDGEYYGKELEITAEMKKKMKEVGADGVCLISSAIELYDGATESTTATYPNGYYGFRVNDEKLKYNLVQSELLDSFYYQSYAEFKEEYDGLNENLKNNYASGSYYVRDTEGNTYTNVKSLSKKSTPEEIAEYFSSLGFYCYQDNGVLTTKEGMAYSNAFDGSLGMLYGDDYNASTYYYTTTLNRGSSETTAMNTTVPTVPVPTNADSSTVAATTVVISNVNESETTMHITAEDSFASPFINGKENDIICFVGVDLYNGSDSCRFASMYDTIEKARITAKDFIATCGILILLFFACFIYLLTKAGRRDGDEKVYLFATDRMFTDWHLALDIALGGLSVWGLLLYINHADVYLNDVPDSAMTIVPLFISLAVLCILDLFLFTARHLRNKSLFKNLFLVWSVRKLYSLCRKYFGKMTVFGVKDKLLNVLLVFFLPVNIFCWGLIYAISNSADEELIIFILPVLAVYWLTTINLLLRARFKKSPVRYLKDYLNKKLQYVKGFEKQIIFKGLTILAVNGIGLFFGIIELADNETFFILLLLALFEVFVAIQLLRFIGGVKKIFSAVDEIKSGNYHVQIDLYSLPSSLREPAKRLMSLRDGLKKAVDEAVKQEQTKTELITNVSHDLKTPLTSVINYVELLKKCDIDDEEAKEYLDILGEKSDRLKKLIEDLVEASKASTGNLKTEMVDVSLNEITSQIIGEYSDLLEQKGLSLITSFPDENIIVRADSRMLYRVLENLMGNVSKYAMENTRVYLNVERRNNKGIISVKNISGSPLNISAEQLKARFVRGDEARTTEGSGLGLSIAESLCELQGGRLSIMINGDLFVAEVEMNIS